MEFGICGGPELAKVAKQAGFSYLESSVAGLLKPLESEAEFAASLAAMKAAELPCPVVNCFVPGSHPITGPDANLETLKDYVETTCSRAATAGVEVIVFGSGGARRIPDGFSADEANAQLIAFGKMTAQIAAAHGVTIAVEPLNLKECNVLVTVGESAAYVRSVNHPSFRLLVDAYHWGLDSDSAADIVSSGSLFAHTHIATWPNRLTPGAEDCDFSEFFASLKAAGYDGRMSFEGKLGEPAETLSVMMQTLRSYC